MVKPLGVTPSVAVSMAAPSSMMLAVVTLPHLRPMLSPMTPRRTMPQMICSARRPSSTSLAGCSVWVEKRASAA